MAIGFLFPLFFHFFQFFFPSPNLAKNFPGYYLSAQALSNNIFYIVVNANVETEIIPPRPPASKVKKKVLVILT